MSPTPHADGEVTKTVQQGRTKPRHFWDYWETAMTALYNRGFSPSEMHHCWDTEGTVVFRTLLPPACSPPPLSSAGAALYASRASLGGVCSTKACFLLSFLPQICSQVDCNLPPFLSKTWRAKGHSPGPASSAPVCLMSWHLAMFSMFIVFLSYRCVHTQICMHLHTCAHTHTLSSFLYVLGSQKC